MDSANDKPLCNAFESNSLRMTLPCFNWKIFAFTKNKQTMHIISLLSHYHITVFQYVIVKYNIWTTVIPQVVESLHDLLVVSQSLLITLLFGR